MNYHIFILLSENMIFKIARQNKCIVNIDYDKSIDFLMYEDDLPLKKNIERTLPAEINR